MSLVEPLVGRSSPERPLGVVRVAAVVVAWAVGLFTSRREIFTSGMAEVPGSMWDHRLLVYLNEHWFRVVSGDAAWRNPSMFHPVANDLGYTDGLAAFGLAYVPFRWLGMDQFAAFELSIIAMVTLGFATSFVFFQRTLKVSFPLALAGAFSFSFSNSLALQVAHAQLFAVQLIPVSALLAAATVTAVGRQRNIRAIVLASTLGVVLGVLFYTSYYVAWFVVLATGVTAVSMVVCARPEVRRAFEWLRQHIRSVVACVLGGVVGFAAMLVPFAVTYLPVLNESGGRSYAEVFDLIPGIPNLLQFGRRNALWGWSADGLATATGFESTSVGQELIPLGTATPLLAITTLVGLMIGLVRWRRTQDAPRLRVGAGMVVASVLLMASAVKVGDFSLWRVVYLLVPGADAIRAPGRLLLVVSFLMVTAWVLVGDVIWRRVRPWWGADVRRSVAVVAVAALGFLVPLEQIQTGLAHTINRREQLDKLAAVGDPPADCAWFVLVNPPAGYGMFVVAAQMDAMLISHQVGLPTVNGYSGLFPEGWDLLDPLGKGYEDAVRAWVAQESLSSTGCVFDLAEQRWDRWSRPLS